MVSEKAVSVFNRYFWISEKFSSLQITYGFCQASTISLYAARFSNAHWFPRTFLNILNLFIDASPTFSSSLRVEISCNLSFELSLPQLADSSTLVLIISNISSSSCEVSKEANLWFSKTSLVHFIPISFNIGTIPSIFVVVIR